LLGPGQRRDLWRAESQTVGEVETNTPLQLAFVDSSGR
jgi:hypothetical protein